ncbi:MAG: DUF5085 family protein [Peptococcia bacterium]
MINIETGKELILKNCLSYRKKATPIEIQGSLGKISNYLKDNNIKKDGPIVTTTFAVEQVDNQQLIDMEFLIPTDRVVNLPDEYQFKKEFRLVNALYTRYQGNPQMIENVYNELMKYINDNNLQQITGAYNVQIKGMELGYSLDDIITDIYIGVSPNLL